MSHASDQEEDGIVDSPKQAKMTRVERKTDPKSIDYNTWKNHACGLIRDQNRFLTVDDKELRSAIAHAMFLETASENLLNKRKRQIDMMDSYRGEEGLAAKRVFEDVKPVLKERLGYRYAQLEENVKQLVAQSRLPLSVGPDVSRPPPQLLPLPPMHVPPPNCHVAPLPMMGLQPVLSAITAPIVPPTQTIGRPVSLMSQHTRGLRSHIDLDMSRLDLIVKREAVEEEEEKEKGEEEGEKEHETHEKGPILHVKQEQNEAENGGIEGTHGKETTPLAQFCIRHGDTSWRPRGAVRPSPMTSPFLPRPLSPPSSLFVVRYSNSSTSAFRPPIIPPFLSNPPSVIPPPTAGNRRSFPPANDHSTPPFFHRRTSSRSQSPPGLIGVNVRGLFVGGRRPSPGADPFRREFRR
ncbi:unnamed protein product [Caenorhabditis sp. 36 PRJEB53466]|nr:unnamed protein product [Caenorhabditis sp. 36 PRJEB53466]